MIKIKKILPSGLVQCLEYPVKWHENLYLVRINNAHRNSHRQISGNLYLDKIEVIKNARLWKPRLTNPFHTEIGEKEKTKTQLYVINAPLTAGCFFTFVETLNFRISSSRDNISRWRKISYDDAKEFFSDAYWHYYEHRGA